MKKIFKAEQGKLLPYYWLNGNLLDHEKDGIPTVPTFSQAMDYSLVLIEGMRVNVTPDGLCFGFRLQDHLKRMLKSWKQLGFTSAYSLEDVEEGLYKCIEKNLSYLQTYSSLQNLYVRPKIYHSDALMKPFTGHTTNIVIECFPLGNYVPAEGISLTLADYLRTHRYSGTATKGFGKYPEYGAIRDSVKPHYDDALQVGLGKGGKLIFTEGTTSNVFFVANGELFTPSEEDYILEGVTRDTVIQMAKYLHIPCHVQEVPLHLILESEEIFLTGTASFITPVRKVGRYELGIGPITKKLSSLFEEIRFGKISKFSKWLTKF